MSERKKARFTVTLEVMGYVQENNDGSYDFDDIADILNVVEIDDVEIIY